MIRKTGHDVLKVSFSLKTFHQGSRKGDHCLHLSAV